MSDDAGDESARPSAKIDDMIKKYSSGLPVNIAQKKTRRSIIGPVIVLLTGSTGGLGSHMLASMVTNPQFKKIYAFNRPSLKMASIYDRHNTMFKKHGLDARLIDDQKIVYLCGDATKANLGISAHMYGEVRTDNTFSKIQFNLLLSSSSDRSIWLYTMRGGWG